MRRISIVGLLLAAVFALSALASSSALAAGGPEYLACGKAAKSGKKYTGKYANKTCSEVSATSEGKYERVALKKFPVKFKGTIGVTNVYVVQPQRTLGKRRSDLHQGQGRGNDHEQHGGHRNDHRGRLRSPQGKR